MIEFGQIVCGGGRGDVCDSGKYSFESKATTSQVAAMQQRIGDRMG